MDLCLLALARQQHQDFDVCVAEDGELPEVAAVVARWSGRCSLGTVRHVTQPYLGFRKNRLLNRAVESSRADYLVFLDGDCLASPGFIARHLQLRERRHFVTGGVVRLSRTASDAVSSGDVESGRVFRRDWLRAHGIAGLRNLLKAELMPRWLAGALERVTPVARTWNGGNASCWKSELLSVNGFDESIGYGGDDIDFGFRLNRLGISGRHVRYTVTVLHLEHDRPYTNDAARAANVALACGVPAPRPHWTPHGIIKG